MHGIGAEVDGNLPVVVDHQLRAVSGAECQRGRHLLAHFGRIVGFQPQLHQPHAQGHQGVQHFGIRDDQVEGVQPHAKTAARSAMPKIGVEGAAMSRGGIRPARCAARPACTA